MRKFHFLFLLLLFSVNSKSQTYVKVNALTTLLTIPHIGIETSIGDKATFQFDITASFWKSVQGKPVEFHQNISLWDYNS